jgi:hypothetical protein
LKGAAGPAGLAFDGNGNLFVSINAATGAIAEYASDQLKSGDKPSVIDSTGIAANPYGADLAFDAAGNLYDADCGDTAASKRSAAFGGSPSIDADHSSMV